MRRRGRPRRSALAAATTAGAADAGAVRAARATAGTADRRARGGRLRGAAGGPGGSPAGRRRPGRRRFRPSPSAFSQPGRRLAVEAAVIGALIALGGLLVYHFGVLHIHNRRPLGGRNVDVTPSPGGQTQAAVAVDPRDPNVLVVAANDDAVYVSRDGGRRWTHTSGPDTAIGACPHRAPRVAIDGAGREYLAFLAGRLCDDELTTYVVVGERDSPGAPWRLVRVARPLWSYGYDDGPTLAVDPRSGAVYVAFQRSFSEHRSSTVVSRSDDHGATWSPPVEVSRTLVRPHLASIAVGGGGAVYVAGIDARYGVWIARSRDGGRSFGIPRRAAQLVQNPAPSCSLAGTSPVPREQQRCIGPDPSVLVHAGQVAVLYGDGGANGAGDVFVSLLDPDLRVRYQGQVNPPDTGGASRQFMPVAAVDPDTGVLWACWYDTTFDPSRQHAWFTCSASRNGRTWSAPERAAAVSSDAGALLGDGVRYGLYAAVAAAGGVAHPVWIDTRRPDLLEDVFTAKLSERVALGLR